MATVYVRENETLEQAIKRFRKQVQKENILLEYRKHMVYESPSVKRKNKIAKNQRKKLKAMRKNNNN